MNYLIIDKLGYSRQDALRNEFIFHKTFSNGYDSHHRKMAHKTFIIIVLWIRGYSDASPLLVGHLTVVQRYLRPHCHLLRTTKLFEQPYFNVDLSMGKPGNQNTSISESPLISLAFLFAHATTAFVLLATCLLFASPDITIHSYLHLFPTVQHLYIRSPVSGR